MPATAGASTRKVFISMILYAVGLGSRLPARGSKRIAAQSLGLHAHQDRRESANIPYVRSLPRDPNNRPRFVIGVERGAHSGTALVIRRRGWVDRLLKEALGQGGCDCLRLQKLRYVFER